MLSSPYYDYEISSLVGYNIPDTQTSLQNYAVYSGELQYNGFFFPIKPEISFSYGLAEYQDNFLNFVDNADTSVMRLSLNGVYDFHQLDILVPLIKVGVGYETMGSAYGGNNDGSSFVDAGLGVKVSLTKSISLKLESIYMIKYNAARYDSNIIVLGGLNFSFGRNRIYENKLLAIEYKKQHHQHSHKKRDKKYSAIEKKIDKNSFTVETVKIVEPTKTIMHQLNPIIEKKIESVKKSVIEDSNKKSLVSKNQSSEVENLVIRFGYKYTKLTQESEKNIAKLISYLHENPTKNIKILGYTDSIASKEYNKKLSIKRANKIKTILMEKGISSNRMQVIGMGESNPIATNMYEAGRAKNRRIEIKIIE